MERIIKVTGKGTIKVKPDTTCITMTIKGLYPKYGEAVNKSNADTNALKKLLLEYGFKSEDVRTLMFDVHVKNKQVQMKDRSWETRCVGYEYEHTMKIEFPSDNERLGKILYSLANSGLDVLFDLCYTVSDKEAVKNTLIGNAVQDAKIKADVLAKAAGVQIECIQSIDYSWGEISIEYRPMKNSMEYCAEDNAMFGGSYDMNIEPDDVEVADTVTVVWSIK